MKTITSAVFLALVVLFGLAPPARAQIYYPWCAQYGSNFGGTNCGFSTFEQCRATVAGIGGFCVQNPFYTGPGERPAKHTGKRKHS